MLKKLNEFIGSREEKWLTSSLCETKNKTLVSHVIEQTNGMKPVSFTNADIVLQGFLKLRNRSLENTEFSLLYPEMQYIYYHELFKQWLFSNVLKEGLKAVPTGHEEAFLCLMNFIQKKVFHEGAICNCRKVKSSSETGLAAVLAEHLFSQLTPEHSYFIDENVARNPDRLQCPCGLDECKKKVNFGNTAIGSSRVWHGYPDIFIDQKVPVTIVNDSRDDSKEEDSTVEDDTEPESSFAAPAAKKRKKDSEEAKSSSAGSFGLCIEMKNKTSGDILLSLNIVDQIMAEAITNAFAQVNANSVLKGLMIPSFGCTQDHIVVFLYDPENDILLQTNLINLFEVPGQLSISAIIEVWMFLNFAVFLKPDLAKKYKFESAKFRDSVKGYLSFYEKASYKEKLAPSESGYFGQVVVPKMFSTADHIEEQK